MQCRWSFSSLIGSFPACQNISEPTTPAQEKELEIQNNEHNHPWLMSRLILQTLDFIFPLKVICNGWMKLSWSSHRCPNKVTSGVVHHINWTCNYRRTLLFCVPQGTLIQHLKEHILHGNMTYNDVIIYYTTVCIWHLLPPVMHSE